MNYVHVAIICFAIVMLTTTFVVLKRWRDDEAAQTWRLIDELRKLEGWTVEIICDNPDFNEQPNSVVVVFGEWGEAWTTRSFSGNNVLECLQEAVRTRDRQWQPQGRCQATQLSDSMVCEPCGLNWDVNDPSRPLCRNHVLTGCSANGNKGAGFDPQFRLVP